MRRLILLLLVPLLAAASPLTDSQKARLDGATDGSGTIDDAALYALLENARESPPGEAGAVVPDYEAIARDPDEWRGRLCLIEGSLELAFGDPKLARPGWDQARALMLRPAAGSPIYVFLVEPPMLTPGRLIVERPDEFGAKVRVAARFHKLLEEIARDGSMRRYPVFVGRKVTLLETAGPAVTGGGSLATTIVLIFLVVGIGAWSYLRRRSNTPGRGQLIEEYRRRKSLRRATVESAPGLPADPAAALDALAKSGRNGHDG
jgi:hypothetical protein